MRKLLFYINTLDYGGAERVFANLANYFSREGCAVTLVNSFRTDREFGLDDGVRHIYLEARTPRGRLARNAGRILKLRRIIRREKPDIVISSMVEANFRSVIAAAGLKAKTLISVVNDPVVEYGGRLGGFIGRRLMPLADGCVFQTQQARDWFPKKLRDHSRIIMNPVHSAFYETARRPERDLIVTVGRLAEQKNQEMLVDAFARVRESAPGARLEIFGKGELEARLRAKIDALEDGERIALRGHTDDVPSEIARASVFALSSDYEGMPNALLEAMAVGLPCVSTDCPCGGPGSIIRDGYNGRLVPVGDAEAMAGAIADILSDAGYAERLGSRARETALDFRMDRVFLEWKKYVEDVISGDA